jgi:hypothetical protein
LPYRRHSLNTDKYYIYWIRFPHWQTKKNKAKPVMLPWSGVVRRHHVFEERLQLAIKRVAPPALWIHCF